MTGRKRGESGTWSMRTEGISKVTNRASHGIINTIQAGGKEKKRATALKKEVDLSTFCPC